MINECDLELEVINWLMNTTIGHKLQLGVPYINKPALALFNFQSIDMNSAKNIKDKTIS